MAAEFAAAAAANTVGNLTTEYASPYLTYFFRFGKIAEDFKKQRKALQSKKGHVRDEVDEALRQTEVIKKDVEEWLTKAEKELGEAESLEEEIERNKCFDWCPSWGWRYCLSKKVAKKTLYISQLLAETCNFQRVGQRPPLPRLEFIPSNDFMPSESSNFAFKEIMEALKKDDVNMIGLYGMGGVGKTTLAREVGRQAEHLFDQVVFVTVSQTPNINNIQDQVADFLDLNFQKVTKEGRAAQLWLRIKGMKSILIILDDVWEELELKAIGFPFGDDHKGCKIFLTTRLQQVCTRMNCQKEVQLNILSENEAWALFKDKAAVEDDSPTLVVAKEVARECNGLPLAIVTVAKALKGKNLNGWIVANQRLKDSRHSDNQDVCGGIYSRLELSYDYLENDNIRSCFLLCSLFPEDYVINIEMLIICGIGQGLFGNVDLIGVLRREIHEAVATLQQSSLLLKTYHEESVKMHDVIRDFAHLITSREENKFMVKDGLKKWPMGESFECCTAISLWNIEINHLPNKIEFSKLKTLFLKGKNSLRISCTFFERMTTLRVLLLQDVVLTLEALKFLTNLRTLCFINCKLENISSLRTLENLEVFALLKTNIHVLPEELVELCRLKSLYFSYFGEQDSNFPPNLLSRLASLQELHVTSVNDVNLLELNFLFGLTALTLKVSSHQCSQENFVFPKLQSYNIAVNADIEDLAGLRLRTLRIRHFSSSLNAFKELFCNVEKLTLSKVTMEHKNIVPNVDQWGLKELSSLKLTSCDDLECLIDTTREQSPTTAFSNLVNLRIYAVTSLKELCHGQSPISFLKKLEKLTITYCEQLHSVFLGKEESHTRTFSNLKRLKLTSLPALESIWKEPTHHVSLQSLKKVIIHHCDKLKSIFSPYLAQSLLHLEHVKISKCKSLEHVFAFDKEMAEPEKNQVQPLSNLTCLELKSLPELSCIWRGPTHFLNLQSLKTMRIESCSKLDVGLHGVQEFIYNAKNLTLKRVMYQKNLIPNEDPKGLNELTFLALKDGKELECLIDATKGHVSTNAFYNLVELVIQEMTGLKMLCNGRFPKGFLQKLEKLTARNCMEIVSLSPTPQSLKFVEISYCNRLKHLFSPSLAQSLVLLEELTIDHCDGLQHIITELGRDDEIEPNAFSPFLPKLETLRISCCPRLEYVFQIPLAQVLPPLKSFWITDSPQLQQVFSVAKENNGVDHAIVLPCLQDLGLVNLINMRCFCSENFLISLPSLEKLEVYNCPKLTNFTIQKEVNEQIQLKKLSLSKLGNSFQLHISANCNQEYITIGSHEELFQVHGRIKKLHLEDLSAVQIIWKDVAQVVAFEYLTILKVIDCKRLRYIFSPTTARSLSQLEWLYIQKCDELDQIIAEDQVCSSSNGDLQPISFPNLTRISVKYCKKLKSLFSLGSARCLPKLEDLRVEGNSKLKQVFEVFGLEDEAEAMAKKEIKFDQLKWLSLEELPGLIDFCPRGYHFVLSALIYLRVKGCPKMTTGFFIDSKEYVHAKTETLRLVKQEATEGSASAQNIIHNKTIDWRGWRPRWGDQLPPYMEE